MRALRRLAVCIVVLLGATAPSLARDVHIQGAIGGKEPWAVPYYERAATTLGPTVLVVGGIHGNEPAGEYAAHQIRRWPITRGRLVVLPEANKHAREAFKRHTPGATDSLRDLNRNFPRAGQDESPRGPRARAIWEFVRVLRPTWVVDLHEGVGFRKAGSKSVGSSVIYHPTEEGEAAARAMIDSVNETIDDADKEFVPLRGIVDGSLARAAGEHLGANACIVETTSKRQARSLRVRQQRIAVHTVLRHLGMLDHKAVHADTVREPGRSEGLAVALYDAGGTGGTGVALLWKQMHQAKGIDPMRIGPDEIRAGVLAQHDLVIFSGGTGSGQAKALTEAGRKRLREFIRGGGGYIGICAGAYLALDGFEWGLGVLEGATVSPKWRRGSATLKVRVTDDGRKFFGADIGDVLPIRYHNGPVFRAPKGRSSSFKTLAVFEEELAKGDALAGLMVGTPAIASCEFGKGRVCVFSPHPEQTEGMERLVLDAVRWAGDGDKARRGPGLSVAEKRALREEARELMDKRGQAVAKRALLTRLVREGSSPSWNLVTQWIRREAEHVAEMEQLRIDNWKQTAEQFAQPPPHNRATYNRLMDLFDGSQGTALQIERDLMERAVAAMVSSAPESARERFLSRARQSSNALMRAAGERVAVLAALRRDRAPSYRTDKDIRVRLAQVHAADADGDIASLLEAALADKSWAVRVLAARVAGAREVGEVVEQLVTAMADAGPREAHELGKALRNLTGENFESTATVWLRWWKDRHTRAEPAPGDEPERAPRDPKRVTFYGLSIESNRVCFLIDTSASMSKPAKPRPQVTGTDASPAAGSKLDVAKVELRRAIQALPSDTHFNVVAFSTAVRPWQERPVAATPENKEEVGAWIDSWEASGNTCLFGAFRAAFRAAGMDPLQGKDPGLDTLVVLSDGKPTLYSKGKAIYQKASQLRSWVDWYNPLRLVRIHAVSITSGEASTLLKVLAAEHDGHFVER